LIRTIFVLILFLSGCSPEIANRDSKQGPIICFGDSITQGEGATPGSDYPSLLSKKLNTKIINAGVGGDTTADALKRMGSDVLTKGPRLVIIEFCGNDFLQGVQKEQTLSNLDKMVEMAQERHAMVALVEVAAGYFGDQYLEGFKKIAAKRKALLIPGILKGIIADPSLKSDQIHPNDAGYAIVADRIYRKIRPYL